MLSLWRSLLKSSHYLSFRMLWPTCVPIPTIWRLKYHLTASHFLRIIWPPSHSHTIEDWYVFHMCLIPPLSRKYQEITRVPTPAIWRTICVPPTPTLWVSRYHLGAHLRTSHFWELSNLCSFFPPTPTMQVSWCHLGSHLTTSHFLKMILSLFEEQHVFLPLSHKSLRSRYHMGPHLSTSHFWESSNPCSFLTPTM